MKVTVDKLKCVGCGVCVDVCDNALVLKDGYSEPIKGADLSSPKIQEAVKMAKECCPNQAIQVQND